MYKVSVVIPTWNRADVLANTIDRIERQSVGREDYEVLVIDNKSIDHTQRVLTEKAAAYSNLKFFSQNKRGAAATRNIGIREASGEIVLFIDDDIFAEPGLIEAHIEYHRAHPSSSIIGAVVSTWDRASEPFLRYLRDESIFNPYSIACGPMDFSYYHTGNVSTDRKMLCEVGGFNEEFRIYGMEDIELGYRLEKLGCRMAPGPAARAVHQYFPTYGQFIERCELAGYSLGKLVDLHPELRSRFTENGKRSRLLRRFHRLYRIFSLGTDQFYRAFERWERTRGTGSVTPILDQHYYWSIRYHFFLGYNRYTQDARAGKLLATDARFDNQRIPRLAVERHD